MEGGATMIKVRMSIAQIIQALKPYRDDTISSANSLIDSSFKTYLDDTRKNVNCPNDTITNAKSSHKSPHVRYDSGRLRLNGINKVFSAPQEIVLIKLKFILKTSL